MGFFTKSQLSKRSEVKVDVNDLESDCLACGLFKDTIHPKMEYSGQGQKKILIIGEFSSDEDDQYGQHFYGERGDPLRQQLRFNNVNMNKDCWKVNAVRCNPDGLNLPSPGQVQNCFPYIKKMIKQLKPKLILLLGDLAISSLYGKDFSNRSIHRWRKYVIPDQEFSCNVIPLYHPYHLFRQSKKKKKKDKNLESVFNRDLKFALRQLERPVLTTKNYESNVTLLTDFNRVKKLLNRILKRKSKIYFDYESTGLKPFRKGHKIVTIGVAVSASKAFAFPYQWKSFWTPSELKVIKKLWKKILRDDEILKMAHNCFSGDTKYITKEGLKSFIDTENTTQTVWTKEGWKDAKVKCYGKDHLSKIVVGPELRSRSKIKRTIHSTENHRWIVKRKFNHCYPNPSTFKTIEVTTDQLKLRDNIISEMPEFTIDQNTEAFRHGLILADGGRSSKHSLHFQIRLCGKKEKYKDIFPKYTYPLSANGDPVVNYYKASCDMKKVPENPTAEYVANFIAGWDAGDGTDSATGRSRVITTFNKEHATWLKDNAELGGWKCTGFSEHINSKDFDGNYIDPHPYWMIILTKEKVNWTVKEIKHKDRYEKVYCVSLPKEEFTLQYGIYTRNCKFEQVWSKVMFNVMPKIHFDTMMAEHILDNRSASTGLKFQTFIRFGVKPYDKDIAPFLKAKNGEFNTIEKAPFKELLTYNGLDCIYGWMVYDRQILEITKRRDVKDAMKSVLGEVDAPEKSLLGAYNFFMRGNEQMAIIQLNGINMDSIYYQKAEKNLEKKVKELKHGLENGREAEMFHKMFGRPIRITSNQDLGKLFYEVLGKDPVYTAKGGYKTDKMTLESLNLPYVKNLLKMKKYEKAKGTYLGQFAREIFRTKMYPFWDLNIPVSYRSSSSKPNFQNIPKRDAEIKAIIRMGIVPKKGCVLSEIDFSGAEVITSATYHKDPTFIAYLTEKDASGELINDMHRDNATDLLMLPPDMLENPKYSRDQKKLIKKIRFFAKNNWTFAQFYGDWFGSCAPMFWENVIEVDLELPNGMTCREWLEEKGIYELGEVKDGTPTEGSFMEHCAHVQEKMWNERFPVYTQWKKDIVEKYREHGFIPNHFGFRFTGYMSDNQCTNYPIQSASFHLLVHTLIEVQKFIDKNNLKTKIVGQIHDSIISNVPENEIKFYHAGVNKIVKGLMNEFKWLIIPMEIEAEITKLREDGGNFSDLREGDPDNMDYETIWKEAA